MLVVGRRERGHSPVEAIVDERLTGVAGINSVQPAEADRAAVSSDLNQGGSRTLLDRRYTPMPI